MTSGKASTTDRSDEQQAGRKKVVVQLPAIARHAAIEERYALELEALAPLADIVEVDAASPEAFGAAASDADALITSWGVHINRAVISQLERCVVIGVGSVGVDMVDVEAATEAGIVVTNVPDVFIEEVADHAMMLLLGAVRRTKQMDQMAASSPWVSRILSARAVPSAYSPRLMWAATMFRRRATSISDPWIA